MGKVVGTTLPRSFALFTRKLAQRFPVCNNCASWKGFFDFGVRLGEIGILPDFPPQNMRICRYANEVQIVGATPPR